MKLDLLKIDMKKIALPPRNPNGSWTTYTLTLKPPNNNLFDNDISRYFYCINIKVNRYYRTAYK